MAVHAPTLRGAGPASPARLLAGAGRRTSRRVALDRWASRLVILGGLVIIASILAILAVIGVEVYPLFKPATATAVPERRFEGGTVVRGASIGVDEYRQTAYAIGADGAVRFLALDDGGVPGLARAPGLAGAAITSAVEAGRGHHYLGTSDGRVIPLVVTFDTSFTGGRRALAPRAVFGEPIALDPERKRAVRALAVAAPPSGPITVAQVGPLDLIVARVVEKKALIGPGRKESVVQTLTVPMEGKVTTLALDGRGEELYVGTARGRLIRYDMRDESPTPADTAVVSRAGVPITTLGLLNGDRTLVVGDEWGDVSTWQTIPPPEGGAVRLTRIHQFSRHAAPIVAVGASPRDKGFVAADGAGGVSLGYGTTGRTLLTLDAGGGDVAAVAVTPKADGILAVDGQGRVAQWRLENPHPEVTLRSLFGKVWYEGYAAPAWVWQSTGGTDDFEAKLSLTPLLYGTLKGTFYALLIAVPLALLAALYVSEFMHPAVKAWVKPVVEIMAALPSVVLGFLAGLWLAPMVERIVPGLFLLPLVEVPAILGAFLLWRRLPAAARRPFKPGTEALLLLPVLVLGAWGAFTLGGLVETQLLAGDYRGWLLRALGLGYDQRNSLVVGVAMGFAVIPIVFTIAEDSLANVPQHLRAGSLALGATRWQTALRIVLPTASPGIFSAVMIGFGRAVGETMIVLMATGNTPVMDWNAFSGFRALSANVAVELPEAPEGGTLFRVLFLAALLLFGLTFVVNTVAEVVRLRLRRRYRYL
jgi:phosphate transport system permease protein